MPVRLDPLPKVEPSETVINKNGKNRNKNKKKGMKEIQEVQEKKKESNFDFLSDLFE